MANDRMSEAIKTEINKQRKSQGQKGIGEYTEDVGGGTPGTGGRGGMNGDFQVVSNKKEAEDIKEKNPNAKIRYLQPRDEDGKFAHNSANGRPLSTKFSRGKHKPVFLNNVDLTFMQKPNATFQIEENGEKVRFISSITLTEEEMISVCSKYFDTEGGFLGVIGTAIKKKGGTNKAEQAGTLGATGTSNVKRLVQNTQNELAQASQQKDQAAIDEQTRIRQAMKNPAQTQPQAPQRTLVGVGAGTSTNTQPKAPTQKAPQPTQPSQSTQPTQPSGGINLQQSQQNFKNLMQQYLNSKNQNNTTQNTPNGNSSKVNVGLKNKSAFLNKYLQKKQGA